jgi:hypothetical protein
MRFCDDLSYADTPPTRKHIQFNRTIVVPLPVHQNIASFSRIQWFGTYTTNARRKHYRDQILLAGFVKTLHTTRRTVLDPLWYGHLEDSRLYVLGSLASKRSYQRIAKIGQRGLVSADVSALLSIGLSSSYGYCKCDFLRSINPSAPCHCISTGLGQTSLESLALTYAGLFVTCNHRATKG